MPRSKSSVTRKTYVKKVRKAAKGYVGKRKNVHKIAKTSVIRSGMYAFVGRRIKKRDARSLWNVRINAALHDLGLSYSKFIKALKDNKIILDRKSLAHLATEETETFKVVVESVKSSIR